MATLKLTPARGYAHCRDPRCKGTEQEPVDVIRHTSEWTYVENGGNMPGVERSTEIVVFADEQADSPCPVCTAPREASAQLRPRYTPLSGHRQDGLLYVKAYDASVQPAGNDAIVAQLMAQVAELSARIAGAPPTGTPFVGGPEDSDKDGLDVQARRQAARERIRAAKESQAGPEGQSAP